MAELRDCGSRELDEYIGSFKNASARGRRVLYSVIVATILIGVATWNLRDTGWPNAHVWLAGQLHDAPKDMLRPQLERWYAERFVHQMLIVNVPVLGIAIDVNDLGLIGGVALVLLMLLFMIALAREHENLCLAFYKARRICELEGERDNAEGAANFLYHALAMGQVLTHPPTLARWRRASSPVSLLLVGALFLLPCAVQTWVVWTNVVSLEKIHAQNPTQAIPSVYLPAQKAFVIILLVLGIVSIAYIHACCVRWRLMFFHINPAHRRKRQESLAQWLKLPFADHPLQRLRVWWALTRAGHYVPADPEAVTVDITMWSPSIWTRAADRMRLTNDVICELRRTAIERCKARGEHLVCLTDVTVQHACGDGKWRATASAKLKTQPA
jgi:hypothetical protein